MKWSVAADLDPYRCTRHGVNGAATAQMEMRRNGETECKLVRTRSMNDTLWKKPS